MHVFFLVFLFPVSMKNAFRNAYIIDGQTLITIVSTCQLDRGGFPFIFSYHLSLLSLHLIDCLFEALISSRLSHHVRARLTIIHSWWRLCSRCILYIVFPLPQSHSTDRYLLEVRLYLSKDVVIVWVSAVMIFDTFGT